jgi:pyruvate kinase
VPILALTPYVEIARKLAMVWGVHAVKTREVHSFTEVVEDACFFAKEAGLAADTDRIIVTAGVPFQVPGSTNILRIAQIGEDNSH